MKSTFTAVLLSCVVMLGMGAMIAANAEAELIVIAAPPYDDAYYEDFADEIFDFHVAYARQIAQHDDVLVLVDEGWYAEYVDALGEDKVAIAPMLDIWMRDFTISNVTDPIMFRYTAAGQGSGAGGQSEADEVQEAFAEAMVRAGVSFAQTDLLNDGGNFVDDYAGNVVVSTKFLADNALSEDEARAVLTAMPGIENVAFIEADEQGGLEHADGVVSFVDENTLLINEYPEDPDYARQLKADLRRGLPGVTIHEVVTPYDGSEVYDERFGSACGLYTNALVTPERIYFPQFGVAEDAIALEQVRSATSREVIPVMSGKVCQMGGGVRCMSWQLRGENARALKAFFADQG